MYGVMVRVKPGTRDKLKELSGSTSIADYLEDLMAIVVEGSQPQFESLKDRFDVGDIKLAVDALRKAYDTRMDNLDDEFNQMRKYINRTMAAIDRQNERMLCLECNSTYEIEYPLYQEFCSTQNWNNPEYVKWHEKGAKPGQPLIRKMPDFGNPDFTQWLWRKYKRDDD